MVPFIFLASSIFIPFNDNWHHIAENVLLDYFVNSLSLAIGVGFCTFIIGTTTAWLTSVYDFPFLTFTDMPIECNTKSIFPPKISIDLEIKFSKSSIEVASAGMICAFVFLAQA